jgi:hypothetical protein
LPRDVQATLHTALALRTRRDRGVVPSDGVAVASSRRSSDATKHL